MIYVWIPLIFILTDAQFTSSPTSTFSKCPDNELDLPWTYSVATNNAASVKWKKDGLTMLTWTVTINIYGYENGYNSSKIVHNTNGHVVIKTLSATDAGVYTCEVTYAASGDKYPSTGVTLQISSCSSGGGSSKWTWLKIFGTTIGSILAVLVIVAIIACCILNSRWPLGYVCKGKKYAFTWPHKNGSKVNITSNDGKGTIIPTNMSVAKAVTTYQDGNGTITPTNMSGDKAVTPYQEILLNNELNIAKSTIASTPPRSGAKQQLYPIIKGEGGNGNGEDLPR